MKADKIQVGHVYSVKVDGRYRPVLITGKRKEGWAGEIVGLKKPEPVTITDPAKVRAHCPSFTKKFGKPAVKAKGGGAEAKAAQAAPHATRATVGRQGASQAGAKATKKAKAPRQKKPSLLNLAAEVLAKAKKPMGCKAIVEKVLASGRWQTKGKTPAATLYSAILREIQKKGKQARFRKTERGKFAAVLARHG